MQVRNKSGLIKMWTDYVPVEADALIQLDNIAGMSFIHKHIAVMPDVHIGKGATIGSVIPTIGAIIPAAVGVDIGCGIMAVKTDLNAGLLPDNLFNLRCEIEKEIPHGRTDGGGINDKGSWKESNPSNPSNPSELCYWYSTITEKHPKCRHTRYLQQLGTLGTGNHFIEICLDQNNMVWLMLHSGSRGAGNCIGRYFIELAKKEMEKHFINLPDKDLAYISEGSDLFKDYINAVLWAQSYAVMNRTLMMVILLNTVEDYLKIKIQVLEGAINCHHNYISQEMHFGKECYLTRKGAISAMKGQLGIIPGSMGAKSYIVEGKGNKDSFQSCSHGAGRVMSRTEARKKFTVEDHEKETAGVECRKDLDVIDETPKAYKNIEDVMRSQEDLVEIKYTLKQILCVKG